MQISSKFAILSTVLWKDMSFFSTSSLALSFGSILSLRKSIRLSRRPSIASAAFSP